MAEKLLQTRIQLKYDTYANWMTNNPVLKAGEVAIATIPSSESNSFAPVVKDNLPNVVIKVGDGISDYRTLKFVSGLAADVYAWAKAATKPEYAATEITGLDTYIDNVIGDHTEIQDTDTQYTIVPGTGTYVYKLMSRGKGETAYSNQVALIDLSDVDTRLDALEAAVGEGGSVAQQIATEIGKLDSEDSAVAGQFVTAVSETDGVISVSRAALKETDIPTLQISKVSGLQTALDGKQANLTFDGTYDASSNKVATVSTVTNAIGKLDSDGATASTGEVISAVSQTDGVVTVSKKTLAAEDIPTLTTDKLSDFATKHAEKQDVLGFAGQYNKTSNPVATKSYVDTAVADLNGAMHFEGVVTGDSFDAAIQASGKTFVAGDVVLYGVDEYVYDGSEWHTLGNESIYALKTDVSTEFANVRKELADEVSALDNAKQDNLVFDGTYDSSTNKVATQTTVSTAISKLDSEKVTAVTGQVIGSIAETDGIITATVKTLTAADIPTIEQSQVNGLSTALSGKQDNLTFEGTYNASTNKVATQSTVSDAINKLDYSDSAVAHKFVTSVKETDGVIAVTREQPTIDDISGAAKIAKTGNVNDLIQTAGDVLVFDCGSSSKNI